MSGGARPPEHRVRCLPPLNKSGGNSVLRFELDGKECGITLKIEHFSRAMVEGLSDRVLDLLEIAALIYGIDASVSRGGRTLPRMGADWHRRFEVEIPVLDHALWQRKKPLLLMFLSDDRFTFAFVAKTESEAEQTGFFAFDRDSAWQPDRVLMFSGGLDSFAGALEEIIEHRQRVALISHFSSTKLAPVQRKLHQAMAQRLDAELSRHFTLHVQMTGPGTKEATHRTRSFLFAVLGAIAAKAFGHNRVSFHENGVVSLNLPLLGNILGSRATRTTHPKTLSLFTNFLGQVFRGGMRIDNPSFWKTKTEIVQSIDRLGMADQIRHTHSCADVHNRTNQYSHCGRCSQCIDRRFALAAAGLEGHDPAEAYRVDLMTGARERIADRELALAYVRSADMCRLLTPELLATNYSAVFDAVRSLGEPEATALHRITNLLRRHGESVAGVMDAALEHKSPDAFPVDSLPRLYGDEKRNQMFGSGIGVQPIADEPPRRMTMEIEEGDRTATFDGVVEIRGAATFGLLHELAKENLKAAGQGLNPLDYPTIPADALAKRLGLKSDANVRQAVTRSRAHLGRQFASAGMDRETGRAIIENLPWSGYRIAPDLVEVRRKSRA